MRRDKKNLPIVFISAFFLLIIVIFIAVNNKISSEINNFKDPQAKAAAKDVNKGPSPSEMLKKRRHKVVIDPNNDPLAPRKKTKKTAVKKPKRKGKIKKRYELSPDSVFLTQ